MAYYFLLSPQLLAQQQLLPANQQQLLAQQIIQSQQLQQGEDLIQQRSDAIDLTDEDVEEKKFKIEPRHGVYAQYEDAPQHHINSWEQQHHQNSHHHHQSSQAQQSHHQSLTGSHQYQSIDQNEIWHSGSEPTTSDECVIPEENISNYETVIETEEVVEELPSPQNRQKHSETGNFEPEPVQTAQKEKTLVDYIARYPSKCGEIYLSKTKQYKIKCHYCKEIIEGITRYIEHINESHFPYNTDVHDIKVADFDAEKCGNVFMSNTCSFLYVCTVCNKPFEDFQQFSKHINEYHLNILLGNPKTFLDAFQLFAKKMEEKTEFVNENTVHKTTSKVRGSKTLKEARENTTPIRSQAKSQPQKCDLCNYQCRTLKQLAKHNELHVMQNPRLQLQQQTQNQQHQQLQQNQNLYYGNYSRTTDAEEARLAAEFILS
ncbi:uncharacterized protein LOC129610306 [Condylostylus longicornis]|uniref:uncharacterized protein LOC129610306 n=1 Tax=Condylostylus longicornis TaxID=2530218 RepID=UPI00244DACA1|nr:uncharacterized protein LOC129610306 [Condylostylus longicornis]